MAKKQSTKKTPQVNEFVLKHRVAGAGVLLFIGALVVPWLLGAPQNAQSEDVSSAPHHSQNSNVEQNDLEKAIAEELAPEDHSEEEVYVSKITPLDGLADAEKKTNFPNDPVAESQPVKNAETKTKPAEKKPVAKNDQVTKSVKQSKNSTKKVDAAKPKAKIEQVAKADTPKQAKPIKVGWAVQVGVFTDKRGAKAVIDALKKQGFSPETTTVDTNKGKATRVWLGPFAQRVQAAKVKTKLKNKTGEAGFIREYP